MVYPQQLVQKTGIAHINLGRFDLAFADIGMPGLSLPQHKGIT
ncbi:MAG: hypothetical protein ACI9SC_002967 [Gammaproteobacteria bacterium]